MSIPELGKVDTSGLQDAVSMSQSATDDVFSAWEDMFEAMFGGADKAEYNGIHQILTALFGEYDDPLSDENFNSIMEAFIGNGSVIELGLDDTNALKDVVFDLMGVTGTDDPNFTEEAFLHHLTELVVKLNGSDNIFDKDDLEDAID